MNWTDIEVSMVPNAWDTTTTTTSLKKILEAIRNGKWRAEITKIRETYNALKRALDAGDTNATAKAKAAVDELKKRLPGALFSGIFSKRANDAILSYPGIICVDADNCSTSPDRLVMILATDPYVLFVFPSPTGSGVKVGVRVKADHSLHEASFAAIANRLKEQYNIDVDDRVKDAARICFISDAPEIFIRQDEADVLEPMVSHPPPDQYAEGPQEAIADIHRSILNDRKTGLIVRTEKGEFVNMTYAAQYFTRRRRIKYEPGEDSFYSYNPINGAWRYLFEAEFGSLIREFWTELMEEFNNPLCLAKKDVTTRAFLDTIKEFCVEPDMFKPKNEAIVHCSNGMVHIYPNGEVIVRPFSWRYFSRNPIPFAFDPNAEAPQFLAFLREALEEDDVSLFIRYMGNVLIGGNRAEKICFLVGEPESGKTTSVKFIQALIGKGNYTQLRISELAGRFEAASFVGKMLLSAYDAPAGILETKEAQMLKMLSGHDEIFAELKYQTKRLPISPGYALMVTSNEKLRIKLEGADDVGAWRRRLMIIEFRKKPVSIRDRNLLDRLLREEGDGILMLAIQGAIEHLRELGEIGTFTQTPRQLARVSQLLEESESVKVFVRDGLEWDEQAPGMTTGELVNAYSDFCEERDWKARSVHQVEKALPDLMREVYREPVNKHFNNDKARGYKHVRTVGANL